MKMYEKLGMSTEDALKWVEECATRNCRECPACAISKSMVSAKCAADYLLSEVPEPPKIPRWKTAKTQEDFERFYTDFSVFCNYPTGCPSCKHKNNVRTSDCYHAYLSELVEVPESEVNNG